MKIAWRRNGQTLSTFTTPVRAIEDAAWRRGKLRTQNEKTLANDVMWGARKLKTTPTFWLRQLDSVINQNRKKTQEAELG